MTPQSMIALDVANERRIARARLHKQVRRTQNLEESAILIAEALAAGPPAYLGSMRVEELLQWVWCRGGTLYMKRRVIRDALDAAGCSEFKLVRELSPRQRDRIVDVLTGYGYGREVAA